MLTPPEHPDILSIVPPKDAVQTAKRILDALDGESNARAGKLHPLYYLELNAVSPETVKSIGALFENDQQVGCLQASFTMTQKLLFPSCSV